MNAAHMLVDMLSPIIESSYDDPLIISEGLGPAIASFFKVLPDRERNISVIPVKFLFNSATNLQTDLTSEHKNVHEIWIENLVDDDCLRIMAEDEINRRALKFLLNLIYREARVSINAASVKLWTHDVDGKKVESWNGVVQLQTHYNEESLVTAYTSLEELGLFKLDIVDQDSCLPRTANSIYNPDMSRRFWVTDTCFGGLLQRKVDPVSWGKALTTISAFHVNRVSLNAVIETIKSPNWYREGDWRNGVPHIFLLSNIHDETDDYATYENGFVVPDSLKEDPVWANRKRLESQALTLLRILETILAGSVSDHKDAGIRVEAQVWGLNWCSMPHAQKKIFLSAIKLIASYLMSLQWDDKKYDMLAPTVSSWEEAPLIGGCVTDVAFMVDAFKLFHRVFHDPRYAGADGIDALREDLFSGPHGYEGPEFINLLKLHKYADYRIEKNILDFIRQGEIYVAERVTAPASRVTSMGGRSALSGVVQSSSRPDDMSLALLSYYSSFDEDTARHAHTLSVIIKDAFQNLAPSSCQADALGLRRYLPYSVIEGENTYYLMDSYIGLRFNLGLTAPELCKHFFSQFISDEWKAIAPFHERRVQIGTATIRDRIIEQSWNRIHHNDQPNFVKPKKDGTTPASLGERQQFQVPEWAACWTIGQTASLIGISNACAALLSHILEVGWNSTLESMYSAMRKQLNEIVTICLKTIVENTDANGVEILRSDGTTLPNRINIMEAFQAVLDLQGKVRYVPGDHTLMWSMVQTEYGLQKAIHTLRLEKRVFEECGNPFDSGT